MKVASFHSSSTARAGTEDGYSEAEGYGGVLLKSMGARAFEAQDKDNTTRASSMSAMLISKQLPMPPGVPSSSQKTAIALAPADEDSLRQFLVATERLGHWPKESA